MTASLLLAIGLARKLKGNCALVLDGVLANDGSKHVDCSTCYATCGKWDDIGLADTGFTIARTLTGLALKWLCPSCGCEVTEPTNVFSANSDAAYLAEDNLCHKCRP